MLVKVGGRPSLSLHSNSHFGCQHFQVVSVTGLSSLFACLCLSSRVPSFMTDSTAPLQAVERTGGGEMLIFIYQHESSVFVWFVLFL